MSIEDAMERVSARMEAGQMDGVPKEELLALFAGTGMPGPDVVELLEQELIVIIQGVAEEVIAAMLRAKEQGVPGVLLEPDAISRLVSQALIRTLFLGHELTVGA